MSHAYCVRIEDFPNPEDLPVEVYIMAENGVVMLGRSFSNGSRVQVLESLLREMACGGWSELTSLSGATVDELASSCKPYFHKLDSFPIEFFNTCLRFSWYVPPNLQEEPNEAITNDFAESGAYPLADAVIVKVLSLVTLGAVNEATPLVSVVADPIPVITTVAPETACVPPCLVTVTVKSSPSVT